MKAGKLSRVVLVVGLAALIVTSLPRHVVADAAEEGSEFKLGYLRCEISHGWGYLIGSSRYLECQFTTSDGKTENYRGQIGRIGADIGYLNSGTIVWAVMAPSRLGEGALSGDYVGASAGLTVGVGVGMNVLVGGIGDSVSLQPLSVEGDTGLNFSAGAAFLNLEPGWP